MPRLPLIAAVSLVGAALALWFFWLRPISEHSAWERRMFAGIQLLREKCPADVSPDQWGHVVDWTQTLHANYAHHEYWDNREEKWTFLEEFERRLQGPVDLGTIDWIWDEYARLTTKGQSYVDFYRPTRPRWPEVP